ncbi:App1 family protein [Variovorax sp. OV329]|uniref:phosphatidate phosphatase App1 family protein n=1 Tax=Variovorax sp. OV329 TaxID=1882825 RepID=UPI0020C8A6F2|nr:App1 family protein [Variovorax sp. OV329]
MPAAPAHAKAEPLEPDEDVLFLPSTARELDNGQIEIDLQAWIHEKNRFKVLDMGLARYLGLKLRNMSPAARLRFAQRTALFHAEPEEGTVLEIDFGHGAPLVRMPSSDAAGRTSLRATVDMQADPRTAPWLNFRARTPGPRADVDGHALLVPATGLSVISDIDDTVKVTQVRDQQQMLLNTFARSFKAAPGMAQHYQRMARNPQTRFHYLSSSPIQLLPALQGFLREAGYPLGSMHLRESTTLRSLIPGEGESRAHKLSGIARLMEDFPQRRFALVGDSGELDPEIYGAVARQHPQRIEAVVIRDVTDEDKAAPRYAAAFAGVDAARWHVLRDGAAWPAE